MNIRFAVEGGIAGQMCHITIGPGGQAAVEVNGAVSDGQLDPATVDAIVAVLDRSGLFDRDRAYDASGADLQRYQIDYAGHTVVAHDTSVPAELTEVIPLLEGSLRAIQRQ